PPLPSYPLPTRPILSLHLQSLPFRSLGSGRLFSDGFLLLVLAACRLGGGGSGGAVVRLAAGDPGLEAAEAQCSCLVESFDDAGAGDDFLDGGEVEHGGLKDGRQSQRPLREDGAHSWHTAADLDHL